MRQLLSGPGPACPRPLHRSAAKFSEGAQTGPTGAAHALPRIAARHRAAPSFRELCTNFKASCAHLLEAGDNGGEALAGGAAGVLRARQQQRRHLLHQLLWPRSARESTRWLLGGAPSQSGSASEGGLPQVAAQVAA